MSEIEVILSKEVKAALETGKPVVALESTIITHGMPYPANLETALAVEEVVRENGAVPATIAVIEGRLHAGLDRDVIERLAKVEDGIVKASGRDLAVAIVKGQTAGTTVSATMKIAALAGISVFATGGVGGVHRGAEHTFDISADLSELGRTPVTVVCAGVKSILDIPKTLEYLETQRVPVIAYQSDDFPAFFTRSSGYPADHRLDSAEELAGMVLAHDRLETGTGVLVANPVPEADALTHEFIDGTIENAVREADEKSVTRKELTPFLLARINELSEGRSLTANIALVKNNAKLAAQIAVAKAAI
ncbi:pseudouridine-5'-phosphate glycosidase [Martelella mediterranea]|uniref:Pseudouridine-5'-phosphate glycosidase n=1 Tax=Martelella mediterranea TaxID=293089 RepID=A0A4R3NVC9_9HYPH|nr:pseudouridine-5'-phosphate glycosidase [Martelella mediterranea]TCT40345.1 pseudouridine-5'-phosphate glycosidase [Martelella mediterranea]